MKELGILPVSENPDLEIVLLLDYNSSSFETEIK
jgi:hypothetical protein